MNSINNIDVSNVPSVSDGSTKLLNKYLLDLHYPEYSSYTPSRYDHYNHYIGSSLREKLSEAFPEKSLYNYMTGKEICNLMEESSPKLPADLKAEQAQIKSTEDRIVYLRKEVLKTASLPTSRELTNSWMPIGASGQKIHVPSTALITAEFIVPITIVLAIIVNPLFALMFFSLLLVGAAAYLAPTDAKALKAEEVNKETLTKKLGQDVEKNTQFYRGQFCQAMIADLGAQIKRIDKNEKASLKLTSGRIEDMARREKLVTAKEELEQMVDFFRAKAEAKIVSSKDSPIVDIFYDAVEISQKDIA